MRKGGAWRLGLSAGLVLGALFVVALLPRPHDTAGPCTVVAGPAMLPEIPEASGLAVSRRNAGVLWSHNDSGHPAVLFALERSGNVLGRVRLPVSTRDWEDVSTGRCPAGDCVYIADIGDNGFSRRRIQIYRVPEPLPGDIGTARPEIFGATYADGPHNAEAMFVIGNDLFIVTKDGTGGIYKAAVTMPPGADLTFRRVGQTGVALVTDAETSPDESSVVVRNDDEAVLYRTADIARGAFVPSLRIRLDGLREPQGEGAAIEGNTLHLTSEGWQFNRAGRLVSLRCSWPR